MPARRRIKELYGVVPRSMQFTAEQTYLQPPEHQTDIVHVIKGAIEADMVSAHHRSGLTGTDDGMANMCCASVMETVQHAARASPRAGCR